MPRRHTADSFWAHVRQGEPDDCWPWIGPRNQKGYGLVQYQRKHWSAHRLADALTNGPIPTGILILHRCDNSRCCNPAHLWRGSNQDNMADMVAKGRQSRVDRRHHVPRGQETGGARLTDESVLAMRVRYANSTERIRDIARDFGVGYATAFYAIHGLTWTHLASIPPRVRRVRPKRPAAPPKGRQRGEAHWCHLHPEWHARGERVNTAVLTADDVLLIRRLWGERPRQCTLRSLAERFGVQPPAIYKIVHRRTWKHLPS